MYPYFFHGVSSQFVLFPYLCLCFLLLRDLSIILMLPHSSFLLHSLGTYVCVGGDSTGRFLANCPGPSKRGDFIWELWSAPWRGTPRAVETFLSSHPPSTKQEEEGWTAAAVV